MKKAKIGTKLYTVIDKEEYQLNSELYNARFTAIETHNSVYPLKGKTDTGVGIYFTPGDMACKVVKPDEQHTEIYSDKNIIDFNNAKDISDIIKKDNLVRDIENDILTTKDNIFQLNIGNNDMPVMVALKQAINSKQVDIKQYEDRFDQFQNDIRLLKGSNITLGKLVSTCDNFDISAELILKDKEGCANPMNIEIKTDLTDGRSE